MLIHSLLPADSFRYVGAMTERLSRQYVGKPYTEPKFNRHVSYDPAWIAPVHEELIAVVSEKLGKPVKKTYSYISLYGPEGICPPHTDRRHCEYTLSLCVSQKHPWPLYVSDVEYLLQENDALLFNGRKQVHYRPRIRPDNHCHVILFHFVDPDFKERSDSPATATS